MICTPTNQIKKNVVGGAGGTCGREGRYIQGFGGET